MTSQTLPPPRTQSSHVDRGGPQRYTNAYTKLVARPNLRHVQPLVREFCATHRVAYTEKSLLASHGIVVRYLDNVGRAARDPFGCPLAAEPRAPT